MKLFLKYNVYRVGWDLLKKSRMELSRGDASNIRPVERGVKFENEQPMLAKKL